MKGRDFSRVADGLQRIPFSLRRAFINLFVGHPEFFVVLVVGSILRVAMVLGQPLLMWADSYDYYKWGVSLARGVSYAHPIYRTPGYPLFLSCFLRLFGQTPEAATAIMFGQHVLGVVGAVLVYSIASEVFDRTTGLVSATAYLLWPLQLYYEHVVQTEVFFGFLLLVVVWLYLRFRTAVSLHGAVLLGLALALLTLTRPLSQLLIVFVFVMLSLEVRSFRKLAAPFVLIAAVYIVPLLLWCNVNQERYGFFGISHDRGLNAFHRVYDLDRRDIPAGTAYPRIRELLEHYRKSPQSTFMKIFFRLREEGTYAVRADSMLWETAKEGWRFDWQFLRGTVVAFLQLLFSPNSSIEVCGTGTDAKLCSPSKSRPFPEIEEQAASRSKSFGQVVAAYFTYLQLPSALLSLVALVGLALSFQRRNRFVLCFLVGVAVYFVGIAAITNSPHDRFRLPADFVLLILFGSAVSEVPRVFGSLRIPQSERKDG